MVGGLLVFFFFKQKTAYEVRISDWSSAVCSSDLGLGSGPRVAPPDSWRSRRGARGPPVDYLDKSSQPSAGSTSRIILRARIESRLPDRQSRRQSSNATVFFQ